MRGPEIGSFLSVEQPSQAAERVDATSNLGIAHLLDERNPVCILGDPYVERKLTSGIDFTNNPADAVQKVHQRLRQQHGLLTGLVITSTLALQDNSAESMNNAAAPTSLLLAGVPILEKSPDLPARLEEQLRDILEIRKAFISGLSHTLGDRVAEATLLLELWSQADTHSKLTPYTEKAAGFASRAAQQLRDYDSSIPSNKFELAVAGTPFASIVPVGAATASDHARRQIDSAYLQSQTGASFILQRAEQLLGGLHQAKMLAASKSDPAELQEALNTAKLENDKLHEFRKLLARLWQRRPQSAHD
jgi:hypothetical protein